MLAIKSRKFMIFRCKIELKRHKISSRLGIAAAFIGVLSGISDLQQRFFPNGITMHIPTVHIPSINPSWIFWILALVFLGLLYWREKPTGLCSLNSKRNSPVRLESWQANFFGIKKIKVVLKSGITTKNVMMVKIISITPQPKELDAAAFPLILPSEIHNRILNPHSEAKFDFLHN